jgi:large subunit ribosomal protein L25
MSDKIELNAESRTDMGKGASRRLRKSGQVPAVVYGGDAEPSTIMLKHNEFIHELDNEAIYTQVLGLSIDGKKEDVILRDLQRHPFKNLIMHADFQRVDQKKVLHVTVPLHFINEESCHGVKQEGGLLNHLMTEVEVLALPKDLPEFIEVDVSELKLGEILHLSDIKLPSGVELLALAHGDESHDTGVAAVHKTRGTGADADSDANGEGDSAED